MSKQQHFDIHELDKVDRSALPPDGGAVYNRLIFSQSPYLLQHATNPVDWYPWGEQAFARARQDDKPVFLSIGYSTCHWCHVMAHESFEDATVAEILRNSFVAIKVDREERPDIDNVYMNACQLMTGSGGWPLTLVLTPDKKPFFAATYLPRDSRGGMHGLIDLLKRIAELWQANRADILQTGAQLTAALQRLERQPPAASTELNAGVLRQALNGFRNDFDVRAGGFGSAPKFPTPHNLSLLLRLGQRFANPEAGRMACATLTAIRAGGVYDQFGFGLHRYSVDANWQVPHFEKMLYDQALFMHAALDAWQQTGDDAFAKMVKATAEYLLRDLRDSQGGFYSGEDADSEGAEGTYYLWTPEQVEEALDRELAEMVCRCYGITPAGNFEGRSIPHLVRSLSEQATELQIAADELQQKLESARRQLLAHREQRVRPHCDDKILAGWNGLVISALARGGGLLAESAWVSAAATAAEFVENQMVNSSGRLLRSWRRGEATISGFAEDYAFYVWGLWELHQADFAPRWLDASLRWTEQTLDLFGDENGDLLDTGRDAEQVLGRGRSVMDGAIPAAGSVIAGNLLRLAELSGRDSLKQAGQQLLRNRLGRAQQHPTAFSQLLTALDYWLGPTQQLVVCSPRARDEADPLIAEARRRFLPHLVTLLDTPEWPELRDMTTLLDGRAAGPEQATAYLCSNRTCHPPTTRPHELGALLDQALQPGTPSP